MRTLAGPAAAVLPSRLGLAQLIEMYFAAGTVRVTTAGDDIDWPTTATQSDVDAGEAGSVGAAMTKSFLGRRMIGADSIKDQGGEVQGLTFSLDGVPVEYLSIALQEQIQGRRAVVYTAIFDPDTQAILDVVQTWAGTLDRMPIQQSAKSALISVTAEHRGIAFARPKGLLYTDGDQQALFPGDLSLSFVVAQAQHQDVWPAASFFQQH